MLKKFIDKTIEYKVFIFLAFYLIFRLFILNINNSEWGDSYRILRATEYLENGVYPSDEKRPPLFSYLLSFNFSPDYIFSSRLWMVMISFLCVIVFYKLLDTLSLKINSNLKFFAVIFFALNPLFLYWSIRIYADSLFLLIVLLSFYLYYLHLKSEKTIYLLALAVVLVCGVITRFEGYLLIGSIILASLIQFKNQLNKFILTLLTILFLILVIMNPDIFHYPNPLASSYVDEAVSRVITLKEVMNFVSQLFFVLGSIFSVYLFVYSFKKNAAFLKENLSILFFVSLEVLLAAYWFAAVPRLFVQLIPFLVILFVISLDYFQNSFDKVTSLKKYFKDLLQKDKRSTLTILLLLAFYIFSQVNLRLPFLLNKKSFILIVVSMSVVGFYFLLSRKDNLFLLLSVLLSLSWGIMFISLEKDVFKVLNQGVAFLRDTKNSNDTVLTNDVSGMTRYYLKDMIIYNEKLNSGSRPIKESDLKGAKYVLITNEHNVDLSFTPSKYPFLEVIAEYRENLYGRDFFTIIAKVKDK